MKKIIIISIEPNRDTIALLIKTLHERYPQFTIITKTKDIPRGLSITKEPKVFEITNPYKDLPRFEYPTKDGRTKRRERRKRNRYNK